MLENEGSQTLLNIFGPNSLLHSKALELPCARILGK